MATTVASEQRIELLGTVELLQGSGWSQVEASPEAFVQRCQSLNWRFFANLYDAFLSQVLPQAQPCYASPVHTLREPCHEVWIVDGSR